MSIGKYTGYVIDSIISLFNHKVTIVTKWVCCYRWFSIYNANFIRSCNPCTLNCWWNDINTCNIVNCISIWCSAIIQSTTYIVDGAEIGDGAGVGDGAIEDATGVVGDDADAVVVELGAVSGRDEAGVGDGAVVGERGG